MTEISCTTMCAFVSTGKVVVNCCAVIWAARRSVCSLSASLGAAMKLNCFQILQLLAHSPRLCSFFSNCYPSWVELDVTITWNVRISSKFLQNSRVGRKSFLHLIRHLCIYDCFEHCLFQCKSRLQMSVSSVLHLGPFFSNFLCFRTVML